MTTKQTEDIVTESAQKNGLVQQAPTLVGADKDQRKSVAADEPTAENVTPADIEVKAERPWSVRDLPKGSATPTHAPGGKRLFTIQDVVDYVKTFRCFHDIKDVTITRGLIRKGSSVGFQPQLSVVVTDATGVRKVRIQSERVSRFVNGRKTGPADHPAAVIDFDPEVDFNEADVRDYVITHFGDGRMIPSSVVVDDFAATLAEFKDDPHASVAVHAGDFNASIRLAHVSQWVNCKRAALRALATRRSFELSHMEGQESRWASATPPLTCVIGVKRGGKLSAIIMSDEPMDKTLYVLRSRRGYDSATLVVRRVDGADPCAIIAKVLMDEERSAENDVVLLPFYCLAEDLEAWGKVKASPLILRARAKRPMRNSRHPKTRQA